MYIPETQSTTTKAPSVTRKAAVTSDEKSTWPGESIKLIKKPLQSFSFSCLTNSMSFSAISKYMEMALNRKKKHIKKSIFGRAIKIQRKVFS